MADQKITQLTELAAAAREDLLAIIDDPSGSPTTKKITVANFFDKLSTTLAALGAAPAAADEVIMIDDVSGTATAKTLSITNLFGAIPTATRMGAAFFGVGEATELTISGGVVTATRSNHTIDTESDGATDDLDTINGGSPGDILFLRPASSVRTVVFKDGTGNLNLAGDFSADDGFDYILLIKTSAPDWREISRSNNG